MMRRPVSLVQALARSACSVMFAARSVPRSVFGVLCPALGVLGLLLASITPAGRDGPAVAPAPAGPDAVETAGGPAGLADGAACIDAPGCIDGYLWTVYQRTPKIDGGVNFAWKDAQAAEKAGLSPRAYVIGGMDPWFKVTLYRALRTLDLAGFRPGIMCGFRDDYRQSITSGRMKAQNDRSFHGGSFRGGYHHGTAADIVSVKGPDVTQRMWEWVDRHENELGIGRPYLKRDPPHVAPLDGEEYAAHRFPANARGAVPRTRPPLATPGEQGAPKRAGSVNPARTPKSRAQPI
jgi:hypothetical protein